MQLSLSEPPVVFVSYSWASPEHQAWVADLARRLRANGVDVHLDRWDVGPGADLNLFMERYADLSARVLVVLSDDYGPKADQRGAQASGVGTETTILSASVYEDLGGARVVPVVPDSGTVAGSKPVMPVYLRGRLWIDFRDDYEHAYEHLLRELHDVPIEAAPPLGGNPFVGRTEHQARALIRNNPARWHDGRTSALVEINMNENSGKFVIGSGESRFDLFVESLSSRGLGGQRRVRHYRDYFGGNIGLVVAAVEHPDRFSDLASLPMSNRIEVTEPGDVVVMLNRAGYWALLILDDVVFREGPNGYEEVAIVRYVIATDRTASLKLDDLPPATT